jgi:hypothetical protein
VRFRSISIGFPALFPGVIGIQGRIARRSFNNPKRAACFHASGQALRGPRGFRLAKPLDADPSTWIPHEVARIWNLPFCVKADFSGEWQLLIGGLRAIA